MASCSRDYGSGVPSYNYGMVRPSPARTASSPDIHVQPSLRSAPSKPQPVLQAPSFHKPPLVPARQGIASRNSDPLLDRANTAGLALPIPSAPQQIASICTPLVSPTPSKPTPTVITLTLNSIDRFLSNPSSPNAYQISISPSTFAILSPLLPERIKYSYTSSSSDLLIHKFPTNYHEIAPLLLLNLYDAFNKDQPTYESQILQGLAGQIVWSMGTPSVKGHNGSESVADGCVGRKKRLIPTVVVEVGWSQTLKSLRDKARQWLGMIESIECVELVMCVQYAKSGRKEADVEGPDEEDEIVTGEEKCQDETPQQAPVYLELWRLCPPDSCRAIRNSARMPPSPRPNTRSTTRTATLPTPPPTPHMCQRLKIFPRASSAKAIFLLTDLIGRDLLKDDMGRFRWEVEMELFREVVQTKKEMGNSELEGLNLRRVSVSDILEEVREGVKENIVDVARAGVLAELDNEDLGQMGERRKKRKKGE